MSLTRKRDFGFCANVSARLAAYYSLYMANTLPELDLSPDTLCSGWMCVTLLLSFFPLRSDIHRDLRDVIGKVMAYVALYLMIDHYLDSSVIISSEKAGILQWLANPIASDCPFKSKILLLIDELDGRSEAPALAKMVTDSYRVQINSHLSSREYREACGDKGGTTVTIGVRLTIGPLRGARDKDLHRLGYCIQLLDDLVDCTDDQRNAINTACTWCLRERGNVDEVVWRLLYESTRLSKALRYHSLGIRCVTVRVCARTRNVSPALRSALGLGDSKTKEECLRMRVERAMRKACETR